MDNSKVNLPIGHLLFLAAVATVLGSVMIFAPSGPPQSAASSATRSPPVTQSQPPQSVAASKKIAWLLAEHPAEWTDNGSDLHNASRKVTVYTKFGSPEITSVYLDGVEIPEISEATKERAIIEAAVRQFRDKEAAQRRAHRRDTMTAFLKD